MLTQEDKTWISDTISTSKELVGLKGDVANLHRDVTELQGNVADLKVDSMLLQKSMISLERKVDKSLDLSQKVLTIVQGLGGRVANLDQENKMGSITLRRHDTQIHELATATGTKISE